MKNSILIHLIVPVLLLIASCSFSQSRVTDTRTTQPTVTQQKAPDVTASSDEINSLNQTLTRLAAQRASASGAPADYAIGPNDLLEISVFEIPDLSRVVRVSNQGKISLPLIGTIQAAGLTARELEVVIAEMLRQKYVKSPQVSVFLKEFQSRPVTVYGAVKKPGVFQLQAPRTLIEMLAQAEGFNDDAGDYVTVRRTINAPFNPDSSNSDAPASAIVPHEDSKAGASGTSAPASSTPPAVSSNDAAAKPDDGDSAFDPAGNKVEIFKVRISDLVSSNDPKYNIIIQPGDAINVAKAGIVYVTGDVGRPGGFVLKEREQLTVLQAISLAEGLHGTAAKKATKIIRRKPDGSREEIPINLAKVFEGKTPDMVLQNNDVLFVPASASKSALRRGAEAALQVGTGLAIYRR